MSGSVSSGKRAPARGLCAIEKVLRVHSGEEFVADDFPSADEGRDAWLAWQDVRATVEEAYPDA